MELSCSSGYYSGCRITHTENDWKGGEITIQIRGEFRYYHESADIYINDVKRRDECNPGTNYGSYFTCGSFSVPRGSVTIQVFATTSVSSMHVKIDFGDFRGSKVNFMDFFFQIE